MAVKAEKKGISINQFFIFTIGAVILLGSLLIFLYILRGVYGRFKASEIVPKTDVIKTFVAGTPPKIGILYSRYTENMLPEGSTWLSDNIATWKKFLSNINHSYDVIDDETIELGKHFQYNLIVLAGSKSLSDREIMQIKRFVDRGGSVFATSGTASFSNEGKWRGWEFFSEVFGLNFSKEIERDEITKIHTLRGNLPITANIPTGYPLKVATWDRPIAAEVMDPRAIQASFWYNYRLEDGLVREEIKKSAGIVYGTYGYGRFVWMGFEINSIIGVQEDYILFERLFRNCISWLSYSPISYIKDWPSNYEAAAIIAPSLSNKIGNVGNLLDILKSENVKATFFVDANQAERNKGLVQNLSKYGEINSLVDIGFMSSINDTVNKLDEYDLQYRKVLNSKKILESITNKSVNGCLPYYGLFDQNTVHALINAGYKLVLTDSLTDRSVPNALIRGEKILISMTKTARDDYEVIRDFGLTSPEFQFYTYQEDIDRILFEGGMYIFKPHSEYQISKENVGVVKDIIRDLKRKKFWITTASEIQDWWAKRNYVEIRTDKRGISRIALSVSNPGVETVDNLSIQIDINDTAENISISSEIIGTKLPTYTFDRSTKTMFLYIDKLKSKESRIYYIDYDRPST